MLEWWLIWLAPCVAVGAWAGDWGVFAALVVGWGFISWLVLWFLIFGTMYETWSKGGCRGFHPWFCWTASRKGWAYARRMYEPDVDCLIDFGAFVKYYRVNPDRYALYFGYAVCDNGDDNVELRMVFRRRDLWRYHRFYMDRETAKPMARVIELVQEDIDAAREAAQARIDEARSVMDDIGTRMGGGRR